MSEERVIQAAAVRTMIDAIEDVAGVKGRNMVLRHADLEEYVENPPPIDEEIFIPNAHYRAICRALRDVFGKGSRVLLIYAGEATIYKSFEALPRAFAPVMRFLPGGLRRRAALKMAAMATERITGIPPKIEFQKGKIVYHYYNCPFCEGYESEAPICAYDIGILKAIVEWATGKTHKVTEIDCAAMGAEACVYEIVQL